MNVNQLEFPISIYGNIEKLNDVLSKARCRIFYKGANRNGTFITDEFAKELISTLHYVPVKGIYDTDDYTDHGEERSEGRIYGIVPEANNFAWENHLDKDGIERTYACTDVYLFTALYPEASEIVGKSQSMELYEPSLKYHFAILQGQKYLVFEHGSFLGLQVLGDEVEPCFEGASFFTLRETLEDTIKKIKEYSKTGGTERVERNINFKLSDDQKFSFIWDLLNPEYTEEGNWTCSYSVCEVYDDYALAFNYETKQYERVYYTKDDTTDTVVLNDRVQVFIVDVTENEKNTLDTLRVLNGDTYELVNENLANAEKNAADCAAMNTKIEELNETISTLNTEVKNIVDEKNTVTDQYTALQQDYSLLKEETDSLKTYKLGIENQAKEAVITEYTSKLSDEILEMYKTQFDKYTVEELDMHLAYELKKTNTSIFTQNSNGYIPKNSGYTGVEEILSRYKNIGG